MDSMQSAPKKKKFLPQPVETSSRSSRNTKQQAAVTAETGPIDRSSLGRAEPSSNRAVLSSFSLVMKSADRLGSLPNTSGSSTSKVTVKPVRRFKPELFESSERSGRLARKVAENHVDIASGFGNSSSSALSKTSPRKFTPQLIETASRSVRTRGAFSQTNIYRHDGGVLGRTHPRGDNKLPPTTTHFEILTEAERAVARSPESRFSYDSLMKQEERRQHSFRIPDLPSIPSDSSETSDVPSSLSTSPATSSEEGHKRSKFKNLYRESCDDRFTDYLLSLTAQSAEKQLREQALAAFPNEQVYNPVSHFAIDRDDDELENEDQAVGTVSPLNMEDTGLSFRRESIADLPFELEQMRRHKESVEVRTDGGSVKRSAQSPHLPNLARQALRPGNPVVLRTKIVGGWERDVELAPMRDAASPPMLGSDIVFPFSRSPQGTKCETDIESHSPYQSEFVEMKRIPDLWSANPHIRTGYMSGLWKGFCQKRQMSDETRPKLRSGIVTPSLDVNGDSYFCPNIPSSPRPMVQVVSTSPEDHQMCFDRVNSILVVEEAIAREFHDEFITQVYNYLSLGYPSLARPYDHELSKISGIPVNELRSDDLRTDAKGYVGAPEGVGVSQDGIVTGQCMRWLALRLYIREWARQQPGMAPRDNSFGAWGVRERRGSWAI